MSSRLRDRIPNIPRQHSFVSPRTLLAFALPLVLTQAVVVVNQMADLWVVAFLGRDALAAVGVAGYPLMIPAALGTGLASAVRTQAGQAHGAGRTATSLRSGWCGVTIGACLGLVCYALSPLLSSAYFELLNHGPTVMALEVEYFSAAAIGFAPHIAAATAAGFLAAIKKPWHALTLAGTSVIANLVLDVVLVFGAPGVEPMGVRGAAWAGVLASTLAAALAVQLMLRDGRRSLPAGPGSEPMPCGALLKQLWRLGLPVGLQELVDILTWGIALTWLVGLYGSADLAAAAVILRLLQISDYPCQGVGAAVSALVAESIGRGNRGRARRQVNTAFALVGTYTLFVTALLITFRTPILSFFSHGDSEVVSIGSACLGVIALFLIFDGMNIVYGEGLRGAGDNRWPLFANTLLSAFVFFGGGLAAAHWLPDAGSALIWWADGIYLCLLGLAIRSRWTSGWWRQIELLEHGVVVHHDASSRSRNRPHAGLERVHVQACTARGLDHVDGAIPAASPNG